MPIVTASLPRRYSTPLFDLFANHTNTQCKLFGSLHPDPKCQWVNSMLQPWHHPPRLLYAFPPHRLIKATVAKVAVEKVTMVLVAPAWPSTPMYQIAHMLLDVPVMLPYNAKTMHDPHYNLRDGYEKTKHNAQSPLDKLNPSWMLAIYLVSGDACKVKASRPQLLKKLASRSEAADSRLLTQYGGDGQFSARANAWTRSLGQMLT